jgi:hypothetical protein
VGAGLKTPGDLGKILDGTEELLDRVVRPGGERSVDTSSSRVSWIRCPLVVSCSIDSLDHRPGHQQPGLVVVGPRLLVPCYYCAVN